MKGETPHWKTLLSVGLHCMSEPSSARGIPHEQFVDDTLQLIKQNGGNPYDYASYHDEDAYAVVCDQSRPTQDPDWDFKSELVHQLDGTAMPLGSIPIPRILEVLGIEVRRSSRLGRLLERDPKRARRYAEDEWIRATSQSPSEFARRRLEEVNAGSWLSSEDEMATDRQLVPPIVTNREPTETELKQAWLVAAAAAADAEVEAQLSEQW